MDSIKFNGIEYLVRYLDKYGYISIMSLSDQLIDENRSHVSIEAENIDNTIFFYVDDNEINLTDKELSKIIEFHL